MYPVAPAFSSPTNPFLLQPLGWNYQCIFLYSAAIRAGSKLPPTPLPIWGHFHDADG